LPSR